MSTITELADRFFGAIEQGDIDTVREVYSPDVVVWHNFDEVEQDGETSVKMLAWAARNLEGMRYADIKRWETDDGFVQQHTLRATNAAGVEIAVPAILAVTVRDGHIVRLDEYLDSAHVALISAPRPT